MTDCDSQLCQIDLIENHWGEEAYGHIWEELSRRGSLGGGGHHNVGGTIPLAGVLDQRKRKTQAE